MATVKWRKQAWSLFNSYVEQARMEYGEKTANKFFQHRLHPRHLGYKNESSNSFTPVKIGLSHQVALYSESYTR